MIGFLKGRLAAKQPPFLMVDVNGVGYELEAPMSTFYGLPAAGEPVALFTHLVVREDAHMLFGFGTDGERRLFRGLLKVSGVGPKIALGILSGASVEDFLRIIEAEDVAMLTRIPGIGRKTAERVIIEMRDSVKKLSMPARPAGHGIGRSGPTPQSEAFSALVALGYKPPEVTRLLKAADEPGLSTTEIIRRALKTAGQGLNSMGIEQDRIIAGQRPGATTKSSIAPCGRRVSPTTSASRTSRLRWISSSRRRAIAAKRSITCSSSGRRDSARPRSPTSSPMNSRSICGRPRVRCWSDPAIWRRLLTNLEPRDVLFVDEIHRLSPVVEEVLYPGDGGFAARSDDRRRARRSFDQARSAAVHAGRRDDPRGPPDLAAARSLRHRAAARVLLDRGTHEDRDSQRLDPEAATAAGRRAIASPSARAARRASRIGCCAGCAISPRSRPPGSSAAQVAIAALDMLEVDPQGFDMLDRKLLLTVIEKFEGGPVGVDSLAAAMSEERGTIEDVIEPFLIQQGFLDAHRARPRRDAQRLRAFRARGAGDRARPESAAVPGRPVDAARRRTSRRTAVASTGRIPTRAGSCITPII